MRRKVSAITNPDRRATILDAAATPEVVFAGALAPLSLLTNLHPALSRTTQRLVPINGAEVCGSATTSSSFCRFGSGETPIPQGCCGLGNNPICEVGSSTPAVSRWLSRVLPTRQPFCASSSPAMLIPERYCNKQSNSRDACF